ncbi:hypothetical protein O181_107303 [Austropuccinia psidii MF-1]|uniref:Uncharacterized protein n=1 Tax=Austropuccinia psidii MF-1 TaxID=1389203 RepID=A0A9Q3PMR0_9BASI|nr:hypothetical protein [Austropuccinia psidii MF-1]
MTEDFEYAKQKWDNGHKTPEFKVGDLILVSSLNFHNIKVPKKLKDFFAGPFIIRALPETNAVQVELSGELENKHQAFALREHQLRTPTTWPRRSWVVNSHQGYSKGNSQRLSTFSIIVKSSSTQHSLDKSTGLYR